MSTLPQSGTDAIPTLDSCLALSGETRAPVDAQHRQLVDYINRLEWAAQGADRHSAAAVFEDLIEYTLSHFAFEEQLQIEAGYQFAPAHKAMHDVFESKLRRVVEDRRETGWLARSMQRFFGKR